MRKHSFVVAIAIVLAAPAARADVGLGLFIGEPTAIDLKLGFDRRSALDIALGISSLDRDHGDYAHITYLATLAVSHGRSVSVPIRLGIGVALLDDGTFGNGLSVGARVPLELALRFHSAPIEIYGELTFLLVFVDPAPSHVYPDFDGGIGIRVYL
jgi:hypothetical protein